MSCTLLLRLAAPLQSWGVDAKFERRGTERIPTKSGIVGMLAAALGRRRDETVEDIAGLRMGVRLDREGELLRDYHTARNSKSPYVTHRYYLTDAVFLVGMEGDADFLKALDSALRNPVFPLFLGRRSCPPEGQISLGIRENTDLKEAMQTQPSLVRTRYGKGRHAPSESVLHMDRDESCVSSYLQQDHPVSFDSVHRKYGFRRVQFIRLDSETIKQSTESSSVAHDPMSELEE